MSAAEYPACRPRGVFIGTDPPQNVGGFGDLAEAVLQIALDCLERGEPVRLDIEQP